MLLLRLLKTTIKSDWLVNYDLPNRILFRWLHVLVAIVWVGLLFYFNLVQGEFLKEASDSTKKEVVQKLLPRALWWFRWASVATLLTGAMLLYFLGAAANQYIILAAFMGVIMFLNVWLVIWPQQKIVCGLASGDKAVAGAKALLISRTNTLLSAPMLFGMLASKHGPSGGGIEYPDFTDIGFIMCLLAVLVIEGNGLFGKLQVGRFSGLTTIGGVIALGFALTALMYLVLHFL